MNESFFDQFPHFLDLPDAPMCRHCFLKSHYASKTSESGKKWLVLVELHDSRNCPLKSRDGLETEVKPGDVSYLGGNLDSLGGF